MIERFQGDSGTRLLRQSLLEQQCVAHNEAIADSILRNHELLHFEPNAALMNQDDCDNCIYLILAGRVSIRINGRELAIRHARQHIGEMALIDTSARRSASIIALEETVVATVTEPIFSEIAAAYPVLWRQVAIELGSRLRERSKFVRTPNPRPLIFIGSSAEGLPIAREIQSGFAHDDVVAQIWTNNVFTAGHGTMEDLHSHITKADFGVLVCSADDKIVNNERDISLYAPRDNVILELGICLGALGPHRTILVKPRIRDLKIPTDLLGITPIEYKDDDPANIAVHLGPACTQIRKIVHALGTR